MLEYRGILRRWTTGIALAAVTAFGVAAPIWAQTTITVAVPNPSAITWAPMWAAIGEGYFEDEGMTLEVQPVDGSSQVLQEAYCRRFRLTH